MLDFEEDRIACREESKRLTDRHDNTIISTRDVSIMCRKAEIVARTEWTKIRACTCYKMKANDGWAELPEDVLLGCKFEDRTVHIDYNYLIRCINNLPPHYFETYEESVLHFERPDDNNKPNSELEILESKIPRVSLAVFAADTLRTSLEDLARFAQGLEHDYMQHTANDFSKDGHCRERLLTLQHVMKDTISKYNLIVDFVGKGVKIV